MSKVQRGDASTVLIVALVVALVGALGFIFWQNVVDKDTSENTNTSKQATVKDSVDKEETPVDPPNIDVVSTSETSPDGNYTIKLSRGGDAYLHTLTDKSGSAILQDHVFDATTLPGYQEDWTGMYGGPEFIGWSSDNYFVLELRAPSIEDGTLGYYHMAASSKTGEILAETFKKIK